MKKDQLFDWFWFFKALIFNYLGVFFVFGGLKSCLIYVTLIKRIQFLLNYNLNEFYKITI
jgi:hypothetical protein